ncbi:long-chain fatty acid--CoA ligase [Nitratireductor mangrovi]|uniref:3-methylmercaptopropionyl-CoA ligase n=1 Tax=Nitratireductor mangrovi TaxID=2599600 RepID=A0A5B8KUR4_9HYPH|nr:AMP-binding protein [Nitratireductor mangrovi]QDY99344.1 long-chain fatty acid--CoA ligase [Nitratireductor mangrovi]
MIANIGALLSERARISPEMEALADLPAGMRLCYRELDALTERVAGALAPLVQKGGRLAVLAANSHWHAAIMFAAARLGAILVPLNWRLTAPELAYQLDDCEPGVVIFDRANAELAAALKASHPDLTWMPLEDGAGSLAGRATAAPEVPARSVTAEDGFLILYTSGTTGRPKGALHTHGSSLAWCFSTLASFENRVGDRQLLVVPLFHIAGICLLLNAAHRGFTQVIAGGFDPDETWQLIEAERITSMFAVPTMINLMRASAARERCDHGSLRWIMCGAAPVPVTLIDVYAGFGIDIHQVYGSTEVHGGIAILPPAYAHTKKGSTGLPCFGMEVRVFDQDGKDVKPGERGELVTRGRHVFREYWRRPEATEESFRDGWFYLGDIGEVDGDGFITIRDRSKDMIISGGENVYPAEIEDVLMRHSGVLEVAVIGQPDQRWGETPLAVVVRREGAAEEAALFAELAALCAENLGRFKRPTGYRTIDVLPRNASGKVMKHVLKAQVLEAIA